MLLLGHTIQGHAKISRSCTQWFKFSISVYMCDFETTLQVQIVGPFNYISNVFTFWFLIIISVAKIMCQDMVFRNLMLFMFMKSQKRVNVLYISKIPLGKFGTMIGYTCWTLWHTVLPCKCVTPGTYIYSSIQTSSCRIGRLCRKLLSTACRILFTGQKVM